MNNIITFGDSWTFGWNDYDENFHYTPYGKLISDSISYSFVNYAVPGDGNHLFKHYLLSHLNNNSNFDGDIFIFCFATPFRWMYWSDELGNAEFGGSKYHTLFLNNIKYKNIISDGFDDSHAYYDFFINIMDIIYICSFYKLKYIITSNFGIDFNYNPFQNLINYNCFTDKCFSDFTNNLEKGKHPTQSDHHLFSQYLIKYI